MRLLTVNLQSFIPLQLDVAGQFIEVVESSTGDASVVSVAFFDQNGHQFEQWNSIETGTWAMLPFRWLQITSDTDQSITLKIGQRQAGTNVRALTNKQLRATAIAVEDRAAGNSRKGRAYGSWGLVSHTAAGQVGAFVLANPVGSGVVAFIEAARLEVLTAPGGGVQFAKMRFTNTAVPAGSSAQTLGNGNFPSTLKSLTIGPNAVADEVALLTGAGFTGVTAWNRFDVVYMNGSMEPPVCKAGQIMLQPGALLIAHAKSTGAAGAWGTSVSWCEE